MSAGTSENNTASTRLGVDVWLDVACPWCAVGERRLCDVMEQLPFSDDVDVRFHSFQLDPHAPQRSTQTQQEYLVSRGLTPQMLGESHERLSAMGEEIGLHFDHDAVIPSNTYTAHRLIQAAADPAAGGSSALQATVVDALFRGYFERGLDVGDEAALRTVVVDAGLTSELADAVLADQSRYLFDVQEDIDRAEQLGIQGVPFYVLDGRYGISGAQPEATLSAALTRVHSELNPAPSPLTPLAGADGEVCGLDGCTA